MKKLHLQYIDSCKVGNRIWFSNGGFNGLFTLNLDDYSVEYKQKIRNISERTQWSYLVHCRYKNRILFFPAKSREILVYDIESEHMTEILISSADDKEPYMTAGVIQENDKIWIFPFKLSQGIFVLDLVTENIEQDMELGWVLEYAGYIRNFGNIIKLNDTEVVILLSDNSIVKIDFRKKKQISKRQFKEINIWGIRYDGENFWFLLNDSTDICKWLWKEDRIITYTLPEPVWLKEVGVPYYNIIFLKEKMILLPCCLKYIMELDNRTHTIQKAFDYPEGFRFLRNQFWESSAWSSFAAYDIIDQSKVLIHPVVGNMLLIYDAEKNSVEGRELVISCDKIPYLQDIIKDNFYLKDGLLYEIDDLGVGMLDILIDQTDSCKKDSSNIGKRIYEAIFK